MLLDKYQVFPTSNNYKGVVDPSRFERLAQKMITKFGLEPDPATVKTFMLQLIKKYNSVNTQEGVCGGMVCDWAFGYLETGNPERPPNMASARLNQGAALGTIFKRAAQDKEEAVSVAVKKMYLNRGLYLTTIINGDVFPAHTTDFKLITEKLINWIDLTSEVPFFLDLEAKSGANQGRHAIGLLNHRGCFYILDPNCGLYGFNGRDAAQREINNHFIAVAVPNSSLEFKAIGTLID
jgi:hypothetical protein